MSGLNKGREKGCKSISKNFGKDLNHPINQTNGSKIFQQVSSPNLRNESDNGSVGPVKRRRGLMDLIKQGNQIRLDGVPESMIIKQRKAIRARGLMGLRSNTDIKVTFF